MDVAVETCSERLREAEETGADTIVSSCPFCYQNLSLGISKSGSSLKVADIVELVEEAL